MGNITTPAIQYLFDRNIPFRVFQHPGEIHSLEQAAQERGQRPEQVVRSILFRLAEGEFLMVLMPGPGQVPWKALRRYLSQSRLTMASEEEAFEATGYRPGTINPFGTPKPIRTLVDRSMLELDEVSLGSGMRGVAIMIKPEDMIAALENGELVDFSANLAE